MADVKQKSKMDKPKSKNANAALPKDARRMLVKEYREAAGERANDAKQRPEQEAVGTVEDAMRSAKNHGVDAAKRAGRSLTKRSIHDVEMGNQGSVDSAGAGTPVQNADFSHPKTKDEQRRTARRDAVNEKLRETKVMQHGASHGHGGQQGGQDAPPTYRSKANPADRIKEKSASAPSSKAKKDKTGFKLNTKTNVSAKAKQSAQKAKKLKQRAQAVADAAKKVAAGAARAVKKVALVVAKAAAAVVKALLAAAGPVGVVLLIFIVIAAIAAILASPFGLFFSGEDEAAKEKMQQTVAAISYDYHQNIQDIIRGNSHDEMQFEFINHGYQRTDNWIDVLAVYAVKTAGFGEDGMDIVELDDARIEKLRGVFWDMQKISHEVKNEPIYDAETDTSTDHYVLYIRAECIGAGRMADTYGFDSGQREVLEEMFSGAYDSYFAEMIGSAGLFIAIGDGGVVGNGNFIWPSAASNYVNSPFGSRIHPITGVRETHLGIDISAGAGTGVLAADSGTVISTSVHSSYGIHLLIEHGNGYKTLYAHMSAAHVGIGDAVEQGQMIGLVGSTGVSNGPHLHFEVRAAGRNIDPLQFFDNYTLA